MVAIATSALRKIVPAVSVLELQQLLDRIISLAGFPEWDVGCRLTNDRGIAALNRQYRNKRGPTDILSFAFHELTQLPAPEAFPPNLDPEDRNIGDMVISAEYVQRACAASGRDERREYQILLVHGVVHLLGYDHETDADYALMQPREQRLLQQLEDAVGAGADIAPSMLS